MEKKLKVHEKFLYEIWKNQKFDKTPTTADGEQIIIIDAGIENKELGGPDFLHARIKIGNITYQGDVEIDSYYSDWKTHGHYLNKRYNSVILHTVITNNNRQHFVYTQEGRKVQSFPIGSFLSESIRENIQKAIQSERNNRISRMPCNEINELMDEKDKLDFICKLGISRFNHKCEKVLERLKEITYLGELNLREPVIRYDLDEKFYNRNFTYKDFNKPILWEQLFYELIFEALGYSKNKEIMMKLARAIDFNFLKSLGDSQNLNLTLEAVLFSIGGLLPNTNELPDEKTAEYIKKISEIWSPLKDTYDGQNFHSSQWHFFKLRPQNFPTIRLAGGARLINRMVNKNLVSNLVHLFNSDNSVKKIIRYLRDNVIVNGDGFWRTHFSFDKPSKVEIKYFIGLSRADEIIVNVVLPVMSVYYNIFDKKASAEKVKNVYLNYLQQGENHLVDEVASTLSLTDAWKRSVLYQGMIELFRNYCSRGKCTECEIGKKVFE